MLGWFFTIFGPVGAALSGFIPGVGLLHAAKIALGVLVLGAVSWASIAGANWWHSDKITLAESVERCADEISVAALRAKDAAIEAREHSVRAREEQTAADEEALKGAISRMERDRAETSRAGDDGVLVRADDEWLQRYRARHARTDRR